MTKQNAGNFIASAESVLEGTQSQPEPDSPSSNNKQDLNGNNNGSQQSSWFKKLFAGSRSNNNSIRSELNVALEGASNKADDFTPGEKTLLRNILHLQNVRVEDLMVPRAEIEAVELDTTLGELLLIFEDSGHSRMPVYGDTLDDPRGMIHIRDLVAYITAISVNGKKKTKTTVNDLSKVDLTKPLSKLNLMRKILFVPPSMLATDLMARMQATRTQIALVIDEYGGTDGLVSLEDIVEEIVGEIEDEHDDEEQLIVEKENGILRCDARAEIEDIRELLDGKFDVGEHEEDADTIGGVIFSLLGRVPVKGEVIDAFGYEFRILSADPRKIKSVDMVPKRLASKKS